MPSMYCSFCMECWSVWGRSPLPWGFFVWTCLIFTKFVSFCSTYKCSGPHFLKAPQTFRARKTIFNSSVSKTREVNMPKTSCMKGASFHIKNMWIKQLCNRKVGDFCFGFPDPKSFWAFEKWALCVLVIISLSNFFRRSADMLLTAKLAYMYTVHVCSLPKVFNYFLKITWIFVFSWVPVYTDKD